jgi:hypothetical protein
MKHLAAVALGLLLPSFAAAQVGAVWTSPAGGTIGPSNVTLSGFAPGVSVLPYDLSIATFYSGAPLSSSEPCIDHHCNDDWTAQFSPAVSGLLWYGKWTRGANANTTGGPAEYTFDRPFTILSGFGSATVTGNTLSVPSSSFHHGILLFSGSVTSLTCLTNNTEGHYQAMTLGQLDVSVGMNYCGPAVPNSTGASGTMSGSGSASVASNDLVLEASNLPPNAFTFFLTSRSQGSVVMPGGSQGTLCLSGSIGRFVGPGQIQNSGSGGAVTLPIDLTRQPTPMGPVAVAAGETWYFQAWHRDAVSGTPTSNFTDGLAVQFQ